jgi:peptidoglycan/LPS O-acetylase OafA/YrhL
MATMPISARLGDSAQPVARVEHSRVPELDGVRAIAIWMVLVGHIFYGWAVSVRAFAHVPVILLQIVGHGWLGVDLFFVLSGFLITGILLDSRHKSHYFRNFYARRFLRIMPLYFAVVIAFAIFYSHTREYFLLSTLFAANLANLFGVTVPHGPGILWSLAVEEHFYLLWPLLVYWLDRRKLTILAIFIIVVTPIARGLAVAHGMPIDAAIYVYSWFRFDGLALGALLAIWVRSPKPIRVNSYRLTAVFVGLSVLITIIGAPFGLMQRGAIGTALRFNQAQFVFAAFLLAALILQGTRLTAFLRTPFARLSGSLSYCIYLIHLALGDGYQAVVHRFNLHPSVLFGDFGEVIVRGAVVILASFGLAMLSKKYLEEPVLRLKRYF